MNRNKKENAINAWWTLNIINTGQKKVLRTLCFVSLIVNILGVYTIAGHCIFQCLLLSFAVGFCVQSTTTVSPQSKMLAAFSVINDAMFNR